MSQNKLTQWVKKLSPISWLYIAGVVVLAISGCIWYKGVYLSSNNVFWGTMDNNLATTSITRHIIDEQQGQKNDQYIQLVFGAQNVSFNRISVSIPSIPGNGKEVKEIISTQKDDFARYVKINTSQLSPSIRKKDFSNIEGIWSKYSSKDRIEQGQYYQQNISSIVLFGNLRPEQRKELIHIMKDRKLYDIKSVNSENKDGKSVFAYDVDMNIEAYLIMLKSYLKMIGLNDNGIDPSSYSDQKPLSLKIFADKNSRQLTSVELNVNGVKQTENYISQGLETPVDIPSKTISISELQDRVQKSLR